MEIGKDAGTLAFYAVFGTIPPPLRNDPSGVVLATPYSAHIWLKVMGGEA